MRIRPRTLAAGLLLFLALGSSGCKKHEGGGATADGGAAGTGSAAGATGIAGSAGSAGHEGSSAGRGGEPAQGGATSNAGEGGAGAPAACGNGRLEPEEACDGGDLAGLTCEDVGFEGGELGCFECVLDTQACTGVEDCFDGRDTDGDHAADCADADCATVCGDACEAPIPLTGSASVSGITTGHASRYDPSCSASGEMSGPEVIYALTPAETGVAEVVLSSESALVLSARSACASSSSEVACTFGPRLELPVQADEPIYIAVDGVTSADSGAYGLLIVVRPLVCGDGHRDAGERCDDGDTTSGDGCSAGCELEPNEVEPNDAPSDAMPPTPAVFGSIDEGDVDVVSVLVASSNSSISVEIDDLGGGGCGFGELGVLLRILGPDGTTVLAEGADRGPDGCARAALGELDAGTYFVSVEADPDGSTPSFDYAVRVAVDTCGDGQTSEFEPCDDGNQAAGDGCAADCSLELDETEPNDVVGEAEELASPILAAIRPESDVDVFSVELTGDGSVAASTSPIGGGACETGPETYLEIMNGDGLVLASDDDGGGGSCSSLAFWTLPAGTYFVRVSAAAKDAEATFDYTLSLDADECGNGARAGAEQCDDGNVESGDGCSWDCLDE